MVPSKCDQLRDEFTTPFPSPRTLVPHPIKYYLTRINLSLVTPPRRSACPPLSPQIGRNPLCQYLGGWKVKKYVTHTPI